MISRFLYEESWYGKTTGSSQNQISGCYTFCIEMIQLDQRRQVVHKIDRKQRLQMFTVHKFVPWMLRLPSLFALLIQPRSDLTLLVQKNYHVFSSTHATMNLWLPLSTDTRPVLRDGSTLRLTHIFTLWSCLLVNLPSSHTIIIVRGSISAHERLSPPRGSMLLVDLLSYHDSHHEKLIIPVVL